MILYKYKKIQVVTKAFVVDYMHNMCNVQEYGSLSFKLRFHQHIQRIKVY